MKKTIFLILISFFTVVAMGGNVVAQVGDGIGDSIEDGIVTPLDPTNVTGPAAGTSTDNAVVRWDGTTGTLIQNSQTLISDAGDMTLIGAAPTLNYIDTDTDDGDISAKVTVNAATTGTGAEDIVMDWWIQENGALSNYMKFDGDNRGIWFGTNVYAPTFNITAHQLGVDDSDQSHYLYFDVNENLTAGRTLNFVVGDSNRTLTLEGDSILGQDYSADSDTVTFAGLNFDFSTRDYKITSRAGSTLAIQNVTSGTASQLEIYTNDGDGVGSSHILLFGKGTPVSVANSEYLHFGYFGHAVDGSRTIEIRSTAVGSGTERPLEIKTVSNDDQFMVNVDGSVSISGGILLPTVTKTNDYTATVKDHTIRADGSSNTVTITLLPAASAFSNGEGLILNIKATDITFAVDIDPNGTEEIDGDNTNYTFASQYDTLTIQSNGTSWDIL